MKPKTISLYILSGIFLSGTTPLFNYWPLVFISFVPGLIAIKVDYNEGVHTYLGSFIKGFIFGSIYAFSIFYWIYSVSLPGLILSVLLIATAFGFFCMGVLYGLNSGLKRLLLGLWISSLWVSIEIICSDVFFSIPSLSIGYLLWPAPLIIQFSNITGVFGISFWIMITNSCIANLFNKDTKINIGYIFGVTAFTMGIIIYGLWTYCMRVETPKTNLSFLSLYTSVTKEEKSDDSFSKKIVGHFNEKTLEAIQLLNKAPNLIIWPETSLPVYLRSIQSKDLIEDLLKFSKEVQSPILLGARSFKRKNSGTFDLFNAAFIIPPKGYIQQEYHKVILAPFVETYPIKKWFPENQSKKLTQSLTSGTKPGVLKINEGYDIGVAICYEALFPNFIRHCVNRGAGILVNITNDRTAFKNHIAAYNIPIPHVVFRAVENRRALVRCANWGKSLFVTPKGKIIHASEVGKNGFIYDSIPYNSTKTFFTIYGFIIPKLLFFGTCFWAVLLIRKNSKNNSHTK